MNRILFGLSGLFVVFLMACHSASDYKEDLGEIYSVALNAIMEEDKALDSDMEFIAIDMSNFNELDKTAKKQILQFFEEKYEIKVIDATFEELEEQGLFNRETMSLDGILLTVDKVDFKFNKIAFEGSKYRSGLGAVGVEVTVHPKGDIWKVKESKMTWVS